MLKLLHVVTALLALAGAALAQDDQTKRLAEIQKQVDALNFQHGTVVLKDGLAS